MSAYLDELAAHQEWADAEHWRAFEAHAGALADKAICERLLHIHQVQGAFLWMVGPRTSQFAFKKVEDFLNMADLKAYARKNHDSLKEFLKSTTADHLEELVDLPWSKTPLKMTRRHCLMQAVTHSHYHRGQNATRLRELGGAPPLTDFILWVREGQPAPRWE